MYENVGSIEERARNKYKNHACVVGASLRNFQGLHLYLNGHVLDASAPGVGLDGAWTVVAKVEEPWQSHRQPHPPLGSRQGAQCSPLVVSVVIGTASGLLSSATEGVYIVLTLVFAGGVVVVYEAL